MFSILLILIGILSASNSSAQNTFPSSGAAGIGTASPDASSLLEVKSTTKGILIPRMTKTQRDAIATPSQGLLVYQTNSTPGFYFYDGSAWSAVTPKAGANKSLNNLTAPTAVNVELLPGTDNTTNLGSASLSWKNLYLDHALYLGGSKFLAYSFGTGIENTAVGSLVLNANTSGSFNTGSGFNCFFNNTEGSYNTAYGAEVLYFNSTGYFNTGTGMSALFSNTTGSDNTANGYAALGSNITGDQNTASGYQALYFNSSGFGNTSTGSFGLYSNISGSYNTAAGYSALSSNTTGNSNVAEGVGALSSGTIQSNIVAVGDSALFYNGGSNSLDGTANVGVGSKALYTNTAGRANSALGSHALYANTTGIHNTGCGYQTLLANISGNDNTALGYDADVANTGLSNATAIGASASVSSSNCVVLGSSSVTKLGVGVTPSSSNIVQFQTSSAKLTTGGVWTNASDRKLKDRFEKLDSKSILDKVNSLDIQRWHYIADGEPTTHVGPIAQEFHEAFGVGDDTTISTIDPSGVALLAIQALSEENGELKKENSDQQKQIDDLKNMVLDMQQSLSQCCMSYQSSLANKNASTSDSPKLDQNIPNPFDEETIIQFYLPIQISSAEIIVSDLTGKVLKSFSVSSSGVSYVNIHSNELAAGTYQYSLMIDGKMIDTKQMVLTK